MRKRRTHTGFSVALFVTLYGALSGVFAGCGKDAAPVCQPQDCQAGYECTVSGNCVPAGGCFDARDCQPGQSCDADGNCTFVPEDGCEANGDCRDGEICSAAGRCIAEGSCADRADCPGTEDLCSPGGRCLPDGVCENDSDCRSGLACENEACVPSGECGENEFGLDVPPNLLILLDRSGSMDDEIDGTSKWEIAVDAVSSTIGSWSGSIRFGLALFSNCEAGGECAPGAIRVEPGENTVDEINSTLASAQRCASTPIGASLQAMVGEQSLQDTSRKNAILLVTDGIDSCKGDGSGAATALLGQSEPVATYVVGFGSEVDAGELRGIAQAAGTQAGTEGYYQADNAGGLGSALGAIAGRLLGCAYPLGAVPPDPTLLYVFFNNEEAVTRDDPNGWAYDESTNTILFTGTSCERIEAGEVEDIDIVFDCPEPVI